MITLETTLENSVYACVISYDNLYVHINKSIHNSVYGELYFSISAKVTHPVYITVRESTDQAISDSVTDIIKSYGIKKYYDT